MVNKKITMISCTNSLKHWFCYLIIAWPFWVNAQTKNNQAKLPYITASFHYASTFKFNKSANDLNVSYPIGIELQYTKQLRDEKSWQQNNCYFNSGIGLNYFNYNNALLGESMALFYVFEPQFKLGKKLKFLASANLGLTFLSNPYNQNNNATNSYYSLPVSAYLAFGTGLEYPLNKNFQMSLLAKFIHISNGGTQEPNKGINMASVNLRLSYNPIDNHLEKFIKKTEKLVLKDRLDFGLYVSNKNLGVNEPDRYFIFGAMANYSKQVSSINALTGGIEIIADQVTQARLQRDKLDKSSLRLGLLVGHEFLFRKFSVNQQLGYYLINETTYFNDLYQRIGLSYFASANISIGFSVLTHTTVPNFTDLRLTYYIRK
jgi:hypothetical protein